MLPSTLPNALKSPWNKLADITFAPDMFPPEPIVVILPAAKLPTTLISAGAVVRPLAALIVNAPANAGVAFPFSLKPT